MRHERNPSGRRDPRSSGRDRPQSLSTEERLSRFLAFVLRHHPEEADLTLDEYGAADLDAVTDAIHTRRGFESATREQIEHLVTTQSPPRFEILGDRIRARYGHTLAQPVRYDPADPPDLLFHGTAPEAADAILTEGMKPVDRQYVHLSADMPAAREVGSRHSTDPVVLQIDTESARKAGVRFFQANPAVWLSDPIPPECITRSA